MFTLKHGPLRPSKNDTRPAAAAASPPRLDHAVAAGAESRCTDGHSNTVANPMKTPRRWNFHLESPFSATHIGPPCGLSGSSMLRNIIERVTEPVPVTRKFEVSLTPGDYSRSQFQDLVRTALNNRPASSKILRCVEYRDHCV